jgi:hypothetical protein
MRTAFRLIANLIVGALVTAVASMCAGAITFATGLETTIPGLVRVLPGNTEPSADLTFQPMSSVWVMSIALACNALALALDRRGRPRPARTTDDTDRPDAAATTRP